ncbi:hypothetical protein QF037_009172 [Streptomyces canus]|nr:hypothetical protein [Streptomyces canus]
MACRLQVREPVAAGARVKGYGPAPHGLREPDRRALGAGVIGEGAIRGRGCFDRADATTDALAPAA